MEPVDQVIDTLLRAAVVDSWDQERARRVGVWSALIAKELGLAVHQATAAQCAMLTLVPSPLVHREPLLKPHLPVLRAYGRIKNGEVPQRRLHARIARMIVFADAFEDLVSPRDSRYALSAMHALDALVARGFGDDECVLALRTIVMHAPRDLRYAPAAAWSTAAGDDP